MKKRFTVFAFITLLLAVLVFLPKMQGFSSVSSGKVAIGGAFSLTDQNGKRVTEQDLKGNYSLVFFGFTNCPDVCPTTLAVITSVMEQLGKVGKMLTPVFISVDTEDDVDGMKLYLSNFHPSIVGLTGTAEEIKAAAEAYKVYYAKVEQPQSTKGYTMDHSAFVYFMDKEGHYIAHFSHNESAEKMIEIIKPYLEK
ncbi:MAG: SCO family protein [Rickettsiales bacterium]|nr:SCO family protein [Rickettsiales bacterium]